MYNRSVQGGGVGGAETLYKRAALGPPRPHPSCSSRTPPCGCSWGLMGPPGGRAATRGNVAAAHARFLPDWLEGTEAAPDLEVFSESRFVVS